MNEKCGVGGKSLCYIDTPIGKIGIAEDGKGISDVFFRHEGPRGDMTMQDTPLLQKAAGLLTEYFNGKLQSFDLPLSLHGTAFQLSVWEALQTIPYGGTRSYKQIAEQCGKPKACRAVGMANNRNPISIIIPCHRVIGSDGALVGYGGGLPIKEYLLVMERRHVEDNALHLDEEGASTMEDVDQSTW